MSALSVNCLRDCGCNVSAPRWRKRLKGAFDRVTNAMKQLSMEVLDAAAWKRFDDFGLLFWNMNVPADYEEAIRLLKAERP